MAQDLHKARPLHTRLEPIIARARSETKVKFWRGRDGRQGEAGVQVLQGCFFLLNYVYCFTDLTQGPMGKQSPIAQLWH